MKINSMLPFGRPRRAEGTGGGLLKWLDSPFYFFDLTTGQRIFFILFIGLFCWCFALIFSPYHLDEWYREGIGTVGALAIYTFTGISFGAVSNLLVWPLCRGAVKKNYSYFFWMAGEILVLCMLMHFIHCLLSNNLDFHFLSIFNSVEKAFSIIIIPYCILLARYTAQRETMSGEAPVITSVPEPIRPRLIHLRDQNEKEVLTVHSAHLLLVKSNGNYIQVFYLQGAAVKKILIRNTLSRVELVLENTCLLRVHRSYIINADMILTQKKRAKGYEITLQHLPDQVIPASYAYQVKLSQT